MTTSLSPSVELLRGSAKAYQAFFDAIASAEVEILVEMYWFASDATGRRFAQALIERARDGIDVRVIYDGVGSMGTNPAMFAAIRAAGGQVLEYHPILPWRRHFAMAGVAARDHRKMLVVDGSRAFVGGINLADPAAPREVGGGGWRDDAARVTGPSVRELRRLFADTWGYLHGGSLLPDNYLAPLPDSSRFGPVEILEHESLREKHAIRRAYLMHLRRARRRVYISNAYFVPDPRVRRALRKAARRGVDVRILVPAHSDVPYVGYAANAMFGSLLHHGVHVHRWEQGILHAKTALIDDWGTVGSYNLDYQSFRYNLEVNVASTEPTFLRALEESFHLDLMSCRELTLDEWLARPLPLKLLDLGFYRLRRFL